MRVVFIAVLCGDVRSIATPLLGRALVLASASGRRLRCYVTPAVIALPNQAQEGFFACRRRAGRHRAPGRARKPQAGEVTGNNARATMVVLAREDR